MQGALGQLGDKQCIPPAVAQPGIGSCDQFGSYCRMWVRAGGSWPWSRVHARMLACWAAVGDQTEFKV
jgi:hypothetical protein